VQSQELIMVNCTYRLVQELGYFSFMDSNEAVMHLKFNLIIFAQSFYL